MQDIAWVNKKRALAHCPRTPRQFSHKHPAQPVSMTQQAEVQCVFVQGFMWGGSRWVSGVGGVGGGLFTVKTQQWAAQWYSAIDTGLAWCCDAKEASTHWMERCGIKHQVTFCSYRLCYSALILSRQHTVDQCSRNMHWPGLYMKGLNVNTQKHFTVTCGGGGKVSHCLSFSHFTEKSCFLSPLYSFSIPRSSKFRFFFFVSSHFIPFVWNLSANNSLFPLFFFSFSFLCLRGSYRASVTSYQRCWAWLRQAILAERIVAECKLPYTPQRDSPIPWKLNRLLDWCLLHNEVTNGEARRCCILITAVPYSGGSLKLSVKPQTDRNDHIAVF